MQVKKKTTHFTVPSSSEKFNPLAGFLLRFCGLRELIPSALFFCGEGSTASFTPDVPAAFFSRAVNRACVSAKALTRASTKGFRSSTKSNKCKSDTSGVLYLDGELFLRYPLFYPGKEKLDIANI
uniref:Uncharacterized protein n=1 Tax=Schistocephalus solidus TaxID=70667 RepID=A0A0X3PG95_SCHSO